MKKVEYRVRPVTRYIVTRYHEEVAGELCGSGCDACGEFDREDSAEKVALALARDEPEGRVTFGTGPIYTAAPGNNPNIHVSWTREEVIREE